MSEDNRGSRGNNEIKLNWVCQSCGEEIDGMVKKFNHEEHGLDAICDCCKAQFEQAVALTFLAHRV